jgi:ribosome biogenesis GTPase / thiamine phosphate phosphatase
MSVDDELEPYADYQPRIRPDRRGSRPRSKNRPKHDGAVSGFIIAVDRGRYRAIIDEGTATERLVTCSRASELRRQAIVTGDRVDIVGDASGDAGSLARIVRIHPRSTVLRRSGDDTDTIERIIVANADQLLMVVAAANPEPRLRLIDRYIVAALDAGLTPLLCITKTDVDPGQELIDYGKALGIQTFTRSPENPATTELREALAGRISVAVGHSGVGKSTLVNELVPGADRAVGDVNEVTGRGRHTSSSSSALLLPFGGWIIDTPGVRSFGLGHVSADSIMNGFPEFSDYLTSCPKACSHSEYSSECALTQALASQSVEESLVPRAQSLQRLMATINPPTTQESSPTPE